MVHAIIHKHSAHSSKLINPDDQVSLHIRPIRTSDALQVFEGTPHPSNMLEQVADDTRGHRAVATTLTTLVTLALAIFMSVVFGAVGLIMFIITTGYYTIKHKETDRWWINQHRSR